MKKIISILVVVAMMMAFMPVMAGATEETEVGVWEQGAEMSTGLMDQTSTLYNGKIYVIGGSDYGVSNTNSEYVRIYDTNTNTWTTGAAMPKFRKNHYAALYDDKIYIIGGYELNEMSSAYVGSGRVDIYDITNNSWTQGQNAPIDSLISSPIYNSVTVYDGTIYAMTNLGNGGALYTYNISTNTWSYKGRMSFGSFFTNPSLTAHNGKIYLIYGNDQNKFAIYDINESYWVEGADLLYTKKYHRALFMGDKLYVLGAHSDTIYSYTKTVVEIYDTNSNSWSQGSKTDYNSAFEPVAYNNKIFMIGGNGQNINTGFELKIYNILNNSWTTGNNLNQRRNGDFYACEDSGKIYVVGGRDAYSNGGHDLPKFVDIYTIQPDPVIVSASPVPSSIEVEYGTAANELDAMLPTQVKVSLDNSGSETLNITSWDKSEYRTTETGDYTVYGTIQLKNDIINPQNIKAQVIVRVRPIVPTITPTPLAVSITSISPIQITADQSVPLEIGTLKHLLGVPVTVPVPSTVPVTLEDGSTRNLGVIWNASVYNPHQTGVQTLEGDVVLEGGISNPNNLKASLSITVQSAEYSILDLSPETISITVLAGTTKDSILEMIEPKVIDVEAMNNDTGEDVYVYTGFTFSDEYEENTSYNPNQLGTQTLIGRFYNNFTDDVESPYVEVEVNVVASEIDTVDTEHINAYQCYKFSDIAGLPNTVTVHLENGMTAEVDVEWNSSGYDKSLAADQLVTGRLVNLPAGVVQPEEEKTAALIVHVQAVSYRIAAVTPDEDFFDTDRDGNELYAGFALSELRQMLPVDDVTVQLVSVTEGIMTATDYELDFTLDEENNADYVPEEEYSDTLYGTLVLPANISNPNNLMYEFIVQTNAVEIEEIEPVSVMVNYYTEFEDIELPGTVYAQLSNGQRKAIGVNWGIGTGYDPDPAALTEDNPVVFNLSGTLSNIPQYINYYGETAPLQITLVLPRVYTITGISPSRIPEAGTRKVNLGSSLSDIYNLLDSHTATVTLENLRGVTSTQNITFTLRAEDNPNYNAMSEQEFELVAHLNLPEGVENPDNEQLIISVRPTIYTIRTTVVSRVDGVEAGTLFADIDMPDKVTVNYTDTVTTQGEVPVASWDGSKYNPNKIGNQAIKGTFPDPLPVYVTNPNNRTPSAIVNVVNSTVTMLSAKQVTEDTTPFSMLKRSIKKAEMPSEEIDGYIERKYEVELLHENGSITTEIISIFDKVGED